MKTTRALLYALALLVLVGLAVGGTRIWELFPKEEPARAAALVQTVPSEAYPAPDDPFVPLSTATEGPYPPPQPTVDPNRPTWTPEPTPPSNAWPTLTPFPTYTSRPPKTYVVKGTPLPPTATRTPLPLPPTPEGLAPADLSELYYMAYGETEAAPCASCQAGSYELRAVGIDAQGRRWGETEASLDLTPSGLVGLYPSPDGTYLALEVRQGDSLEVYVANRSSGLVWELIGPSLNSGSVWDWTPGNRLLFRPFDTSNYPADVVMLGVLMVNPETGEYDQLDLPVHQRHGYSLVQNASVSPDGSRLAYSITYANQAEISELWIMDLESGDTHLLWQANGLINPFTLSWSPVGNQVIYIYQPKAGSNLPSELRLVDTITGEAKLLAANPARPSEWPYRPVWSPDGRYVAYVQFDDPVVTHNKLPLGAGNVYAVDTTDGEVIRLSFFIAQDTAYPTWSPDGQQVAFVSTPLEGEPVYSEVWVVDIAKRQMQLVAGPAQWHSPLAWVGSAAAQTEATTLPSD